MSPGLETIVDATGCSAIALCDVAVMQSFCERLIDDLGLQVVEQPQWHVFSGPGGVTGLYLLTESHLACHTYPEFGLATFNLYCCRERVAWNWRHWLQRLLRAQHVEVRTVTRGGRSAAACPTVADIVETASPDSGGLLLAGEKQP